MTSTLLHAVVRGADARTPDPDLLARFAHHRDDAAFAELVRRHGPLVWAVCRQLLPHHADAEDAFQAVFLALVRGAATVRAGHALPAWLHGAAVRVALKARRAAARRRRREEHAAVPEADRPVPDAAWANLMAAVHEEVRSLPDPERTAFVLCDLEGVRQPDAADRLGWPLGTLSGRLCKARQKLLDRLTRRGIAPATLALGGLAGSAGTVPAALAERVSSLPAAGTAGVSSAVAVLARGLAEGVTMRTKLAVGALLVAGAVGLGGGAMVLSNAEAQGPPGVGPALPGQGGTAQTQPPAGGGTVPMSRPGGTAQTQPPTGGLGGALLGGAARLPAWEYKFVDQKSADRDAFEKTLTQLGGDGWEYAGSERLQKGNEAAQTVLVFKRPKGGVGGLGGGRGGPGGPGGGEGAGTGSGRGRAGSTPGGGGEDGGGENLFKVFKLNHAPAADVVAALQKLLPDTGLRVVAETGSNSVVVVRADPSTLKEVARVIEVLDPKPAGSPVGGGEGAGAGAPAKPVAGINVFELKHANAVDTAELLKKLFPGTEFVPDPRTNAVVARADDVTLEAARAVLARLDAVPTPAKR